MVKVLIVFDSKHGATAHTARHLADEVTRRRGTSPDLLDLRKHRIREGFPLEPYDSVLLGGPLYMGKYSPRLCSFAARHWAQLETKTRAWFVLGNGAGLAESAVRASLPPEIPRETEEILWLGYHLQFSQLSFWEKWLVRLVGGKAESSFSWEPRSWDRLIARAAYE